jgi:hypothetical protein
MPRLGYREPQERTKIGTKRPESDPSFCQRNIAFQGLARQGTKVCLRVKIAWAHAREGSSPSSGTK